MTDKRDDNGSPSAEDGAPTTRAGQDKRPTAAPSMPSRSAGQAGPAKAPEGPRQQAEQSRPGPAEKGAGSSAQGKSMPSARLSGTGPSADAPKTGGNHPAERTQQKAGAKPGGEGRSAPVTREGDHGESAGATRQNSPGRTGSERGGFSQGGGRGSAPAGQGAGSPKASGPGRGEQTPPSGGNGGPTNRSSNEPNRGAPTSKPASATKPGAVKGTPTPGAGTSARPGSDRPRPNQPQAPRSGDGSHTPPARTGNGEPRKGGGGQPQRQPQASRRAPGPAPASSASTRDAGPSRAEAARPAGRQEAPAQPPVTEIVIPAQITVRELAEKTRRSPIEVIKTLMNYGIMVPITHSIDFDTATVVCEELGITVKPELPPEPEVEAAPEEAPRTLRQRIMADENQELMVERPPIVTVLGHVDHGKTTLLDAIRETRVVDGEAGGITQHIGAYQVERQGRRITFLDTPGHEAFTAMRARGAMVTDIAVLVVAADDGVMPQTKEAIAHAQAARVPIIVALNKVDKPAANPDRVKQELADNGLLIEEYGGDVICVPVSAKFRRGIDDLLVNVLLVADVDPLKANPGGACVGTVIESRLDKTRGPVATLLVQNGSLRVGDSLVMGETYGKIRAMYDDKGQPISEALPATPVAVLGLADVAGAGDTFSVQSDERTARAIALERQQARRAATVAAAPRAMALEDVFAQAQAGQTKELTLIVKADVQGSIEPIVNSLEKLGDEKLRVKILHQATGNVNESDIMLAIASKAIILGFNVVVDTAAQRMAETEGVDIRIYNIIYNLIEDIQKALTGLLEPVYKEVITGHLEIRAVFRISKVGKVAGCYVTDGEIARGTMARIKRAGQVVGEDKIVSLKRYQEDVAEVKTSFECGLNFGNFNDFEVGDVVEAYRKERVR